MADNYDALKLMPPGPHRLSMLLPGLAEAVEEIVKEHGGTDSFFCIICGTNNKTGEGSAIQYVSNANREDMKGALEELLARWAAGMGDVPAHENPETPDDA